MKLYRVCKILKFEKNGRILAFKLGSTVGRDVQWYSEARKPGYKMGMANFFSSDGMYWVVFNPICAAVDEGKEVSEWRIVDGR